MNESSIADSWAHLLSASSPHMALIWGGGGGGAEGLAIKPTLLCGLKPGPLTIARSGHVQPAGFLVSNRCMHSKTSSPGLVCLIMASVIAWIAGRPNGNCTPKAVCHLCPNNDGSDYSVLHESTLISRESIIKLTVKAGQESM